MAKSRFEKIHTGLESSAKAGKFDKEVTIFLSYVGRLKSEGFEVEILSRSQRNNALVTVKVSWRNACKNVGEATLKHYIRGNIDIMPNPAFKLCVLAHRATT